MSTVFISYRRDDSQEVTGRLHDHLVARFGKETVFKDVDSIPLGADFRHATKQAIESSDVLLVVIGPQWLDAKDKKGNRKLDSPNDYVRLEIRSALSRGIPVVPVLVGGSRVPSAELLPAEIQPVAFRNAMEVRNDPDFTTDVSRLCSSLDKMLAASRDDCRTNIAPLIEYTFIDRQRLSMYVDQIKGEGTASKSLSGHEMIQLLLRHLVTHNQLANRRPDSCHDHRSDDCQPFVSETMEASKAIIPVPDKAKAKGLKNIAVWVSDPPELVKPPEPDRFVMDREGTFVYLIESYWHHNDVDHLGRSEYGWAMSGYSALMWIMDELVESHVISEQLRQCDKYGEHPIDRLKRIGATISPKRRIKALYRKRLISDNAAIDSLQRIGLSSYTTERREFNDVVGYPLFIASV